MGRGIARNLLILAVGTATTIILVGWPDPWEEPANLESDDPDTLVRVALSADLAAGRWTGSYPAARQVDAANARREARRRLAAMGPRAVPPLLRAQCTVQFSTGWTAETLRAMGPAAFPGIREALAAAREDEIAWYHIADVAAQLGTGFHDFVKTSPRHPQDRWDCWQVEWPDFHHVVWLGSSRAEGPRSPGLAREFLNALWDPRWRIQYPSAKGLAVHATAEIVPELIAILDDVVAGRRQLGNSEARCVVNALIRTGDPRAAEIVWKLAKYYDLFLIPPPLATDVLEHARTRWADADAEERKLIVGVLGGIRVDLGPDEPHLSDSVAEWLRALAGDKDPAARAHSLRILAQAGWPEAEKLLAGAWDDPDELVRYMAYAIVGETRWKSAATRLRKIALMTSRPAWEHEAARKLLYDVDPVRWRAIARDDLRARRIPEAIPALYGLAEMQDATILPELMDILRTWREGVYKKGDGLEVAAVFALGRLRGREAVPTLVEMIRTVPYEYDSMSLMENAATALGEIGDPAAIPALREALQSRGEERISFTDRLHIALLRLGDSSHLPRVRWILEEGGGYGVSSCRHFGLTIYSETTDLAARALAEAGPEGIEILVAADSFTRPYMIRALGRSGAEAALPALLRCLAEGSDAAAPALADFGDPSAIPALRDAASSGSPHLRRAAREALAQLEGTPR